MSLSTTLTSEEGLKKENFFRPGAENAWNTRLYLRGGKGLGRT